MRDLILSCLDRATDAQIQAGLCWYEKANQEIAERIPLPIYKACSLVAITSPRTPWKQNIQLVLDLLDGKKVTTNKQWTECWHARNGGPYVPSGPKRMRFFHNLLFPERSLFVTIDTWILRVLLPNETDLSRQRWIDRKGNYHLAERCVQDVAGWVGLLPHQVQAICWIVKKEEY